MSRFFEKKELTEKLRKKPLLIKLVIVILTLAAIVFVLCSSFEIVTIPGGIEKKEIILNDQNLRDISMENLLVSISTALSAILAIVFAFSQMIVSNISDRYSPHILEKYRGDRKTYSTFLIFIVTILISVFSFIFVRRDSNLVRLVILLVLIVLISSCFYRFVDYSDYVFEIINPLNFVKKLGYDIDRNVEQVNDGKTEKSINALGDIAVKSLRRDEDEVVREILDVKFGVFENFLELRKKELAKYSSIYRYPNDRKNVAFACLLNQQLRLFKEAIRLENDDVTQQIGEKLYHYIFALLHGQNNGDLIKQILETRDSTGYFSLFLREAVENKNTSREFLLRIFPDMLQVNRFLDTKIGDEYIEDLILTHIYRINQIVVDFEDFDLFKKEIDDYSKLLIDYDPVSIKEEIVNLLYLHFSDISRFFNRNEEIAFFDQRSEDLRSYARFELHFLKDNYGHFSELIKDFLNKVEESCNSINIDLQIKNDPERFKNWTDENIENYKRKIKSEVSTFMAGKNNWIAEIDRRLYDLHVSSILYQTFFGIGWYIVFCKRQKNLHAQKYLKEFWEHTRPEDSNIRTLNEPPVSFNIEFITQILLQGRGIWTFPPFFYVGFHDPSKYIYLYYLLLLTYSRVRLGNDLEITLRDRDTQGELEDKYEFICRFIEEGDQGGTGNLVKYIDELIQEADDWGELMNFREKNMSAKDAFQDTREWIKRKVKEFQELKKQIAKRLPIDKGKEKNCREEILNSYKRSSTIPEAVDQEEFDEKEDRDMKFIQIYWKRYWTKTDFINILAPHVPWGDIGNYISKGEEDYFLKQIFGNDQIMRVEVPKEEDFELLFSRIFEMIKELKGGLNPLSIFLPMRYLGEILSKSRKTDSILNGKINHKNDGIYLVYDENTHLKLFFYPDNIPSDSIAILNKSVGIWTYKVDERTKERLFIDISEHETDKSLVGLYVRTIINLRIVNPERARILRLQ